MNAYVLLHFEQKNDITIIVKFLYRAASSSVKFDNDCDIIFMFKMKQIVGSHGISVLY